MVIVKVVEHWNFKFLSYGVSGKWSFSRTFALSVFNFVVRSYRKVFVDVCIQILFSGWCEKCDESSVLVA